MSEYTEKLEALAGALASMLGADSMRRDEPMAAHTTFKIGGPADLYVTPSTEDELALAVRACADTETPYLLLGLGSDLLVGDLGIRGVVIDCAAKLSGVDVKDGSVGGESAAGDAFEANSARPRVLVCQAGAAIADVSALAASLGLTGLEFACGIPGSVGGAVFMNAGAYDGCVADVLKSARCLMASGFVEEVPASELELGYRTSRVRTEGLTVLSATFALAPGDPEEIAARVAELTEARASKQPLELPSAGSTFKRPEGHFAGKLITDAGLKGYQVGGAAVSEKHAGFVVNLGGATAADVRAVIAHVQDEVKRRFDVSLEPEVRMVGEF